MDYNLGRIGVCIYCGSTENLTDEHVIPRALGGPAQLFDASCTECNKKTGAFERLVLREQLGPFRVRLGLPTSHAKMRPTAFPARVRSGSEWREVQLPIEKYTAVGAFPRFPSPGVIAGRAPGAGIRIEYVGVAVVPRDGIGMDPARRAGADEIEQTLSVFPYAFMQMLAKIAWGFSVSLLGLGRLNPAILGVILGTDPDPARWVGCPPLDESGFDIPPSDAPLQVRIRELGPYVFGSIRLFADKGAPEYVVVVGRTREPPSS